MVIGINHIQRLELVEGDHGVCHQVGLFDGEFSGSLADHDRLIGGFVGLDGTGDGVGIQLVAAVDQIANHHQDLPVADLVIVHLIPVAQAIADQRVIGDNAHSVARFHRLSSKEPVIKKQGTAS